MQPTLTTDADRRDGIGFALHRPEVRGTVPGPRSRALLSNQARYESNARAYPRRLPIALKRGHGAFVEDEDGNVFIDFLMGAGALALGYGHSELVERVCEQTAQLTHALDFPTAVKDEFTHKLLGILPTGMREHARVHFCGPTGANAVEAAIKLCKKATGRGDIVAFAGGFHGMTHATMAVSGESELRADVPNVMPGVHFAPFAYCHRCPLGLARTTCSTNCADLFERTLRDSHSGVGKPAAVILELVQGEGGTVVAPRDFVQRVRHITTELNIPLIVDEVQTGCGRTGEWFAFQHYDIEPDVLVLSKMLSGIGMPMSAIIYHERLDGWQPGSHTGTFRGNQLAFAAGASFIDIVHREHLLANVRARGSQAEQRLRHIQASSGGLISDVRGLGLMIGMECSRPDNGGPWPEAAAAIQQHALQRGLIVEIGGRENGVVRMLPPLNIDATTLDTALAIVEAAVGETVASLAIEPRRSA